MNGLAALGGNIELRRVDRDVLDYRHRMCIGDGQVTRKLAAGHVRREEREIEIRRNHLQRRLGEIGRIGYVQRDRVLIR